jgi:intracellular sulfur oxidation DsrE/DsrF family protein
MLGAQPCRMRKTIALLIGLSLAALAHAADPDLVIAGRGASLEQAVAAPHAANYRLLVLRQELQRVRASRAEEEVRALLVRARSEGAVVFVCERDLRKQRLQPADLLPGIVAVDASDVWVNGTPGPADVRLKSLCS